MALGGCRILTALDDIAEARRWPEAAEAGEDRLDDDFDENDLSLTLR